VLDHVARRRVELPPRAAKGGWVLVGVAAGIGPICSIPLESPSPTHADASEKAVAAVLQLARGTVHPAETWSIRMPFSPAT